MAKLSPEPYDLPEPDDWHERMDAQDEVLEELLEKSKEVPEDEVVGVMLRFPVADNYAWYRVIGEDPLTVQHVPVTYSVDRTMIRGLRREDVDRYGIRGEGLFGKHKV